MSESIHGHEVMQMMVESDQSFSKKTLEEAIISKFGENAKFYTCSQEDMTAVELIAFLESRGKFIEEGQGFTTEEEKMCNH